MVFLTLTTTPLIREPSHPNRCLTRLSSARKAVLCSALLPCMSASAAPVCRRGFHVATPHLKSFTVPRNFHSSSSRACLPTRNRLRPCVTTLCRSAFDKHPSSFNQFSLLSCARLFSSKIDMDLNGEARPKRKLSPVQAIERPAKHLRPEIAVPTPGDTTPQNGTVYDVENDLDVSRMQPPLAAATDSPEWQATIEKVVKSVVSIHFCQTCSFDTDLSMSSQATGFVVDSEKGYILTNRHVVCAGPFSGYCIFDNHEEVRFYLFNLWNPKLTQLS